MEGALRAHCSAGCARATRVSITKPNPPPRLCNTYDNTDFLFSFPARLSRAADRVGWGRRTGLGAEKFENRNNVDSSMTSWLYTIATAQHAYTFGHAPIPPTTPRSPNRPPKHE